MTGTLRRRATNDITGDSFPIRAATELCRQRLQECASQASLREGHWAENRSSDFNLWDSGVGACANELNCLDKRLERDTSAQKVVIGALSTLAAWTTRCKELAEAVHPTFEPPDHQAESTSICTEKQCADPSDSISLDDAKTTVEGLLKILIDLEIAIRRAGTASRVRRADRTFNRRKHHYAELSGHLEFILRVSGAPRQILISANQGCAPANIGNVVIASASDQSGAPQLSHSSGDQRPAPARSDQIDVKSTLDQLCGEKAPLRPEQQLLLLANLKRTDRFLFYRGRHEQLQPKEAPKPSQAVRALRVSRAQPSDPPIKSEEQLKQSQQPSPHKHATQAQSQHSTGTTNQASHYVPDLSLEKAMEVTSPGVAATTIALRADYPKPPRDRMRCPYCLIPFKGENSDVHQWRKHASEDLQPYTCYLPNCPQGHPFFSTFDAWKAHVLSKDHKQFEGWTCFFCQFSSKPTEESIMSNHIKSNHSNAVGNDSLTNFANMCRRYTAPALDRCPVCSTHEHDWKLRKDSDPKFDPGVTSILEHIGQCMHFFSLRVLPDAEPVTPGNGSGQNPTNVSPIEDRSWPSCYLHVSHHTDAGLTETDLEAYPELTHHDQVLDTQRTQTWVELAENMDNPDSLDEQARLEPRYDNATSEDDLDDEDFLSGSPASSTLENRLLRSFVASTFDGRSRPYLPEGLISELVTAESIREELELDHLEEKIAAKLDQSRQAELVDWIRTGASKLFAICVECVIRPRRNMLATFLRFKKYSFDDKSLPIRDPRDDPGPTASKSLVLIFHEQVWSMLNLYNFYEKQWKYLAPVFGIEYDYDLPSDCILPFHMDREGTGQGGFSTVYKVNVHPNHMRHKVSEKVAIKEMKATIGNDAMNANTSWELEARALRTIGTMKSEHIVSCIAAIRRGDSRYFMFPWADGGNLRDYWEGIPRQTPQRRIIEETIIQLRGIADTLDKLHNFRREDAPHEDGSSIQVEGPSELGQAGDEYFADTEPRESIRHGDLKPENILRFSPGTSSIGQLRIADMGLAKRHAVATQSRTRYSSTRYGTRLYEAPEAVILDIARSRLYDIWSMGCITLEFIIWLLYGNDELKNFYRHLQGDNYQTNQFFEIRDTDGRKHAKVHPVVQFWIDHIRNTDPECSQNSAIRDLLDIVHQKLLVVSLPPGKANSTTFARTLSPPSLGEEVTRYRATASQFRDSLDDILVKVRKDPVYLLTGHSRANLQRPAIARAHPLTVGRSLGRQTYVDDFTTEPYRHAKFTIGSSVRRNVSWV